MKWFSYNYLTTEDNKQLSILFSKWMVIYYQNSDWLTEPNQYWEGDMSEFRRQAIDPLSGKRKYVLYVMERDTTSGYPETNSEYQKKIEWLETVSNNRGNYVNDNGLKDLIDAGVLEIVYNVPYNQSVGYYASLIEGSMNDVGFNINC
jgi:hypothetical protein